MSQSVDIGHGVTIETCVVDDEFYGVRYEHPSAVSPTGRCSGYAPVKPHNADGWDVLQFEPLTLSPSLQCRACDHHGFITNGRWVPA